MLVDRRDTDEVKELRRGEYARSGCSHVPQIKWRELHCVLLGV
jgi:hypothetical protein